MERIGTLLLPLRRSDVPLLIQTNRKMKFSELYRLLESHGWICREGSGHRKYVHPDFEFFIPVGRHKSQEVPSGTLKSILRAAKIQQPKR